MIISFTIEAIIAFVIVVIVIEVVGATFMPLKVTIAKPEFRLRSDSSDFKSTGFMSKHMLSFRIKHDSFRRRATLNLSSNVNIPPQ